MEASESVVGSYQTPSSESEQDFQDWLGLGELQEDEDSEHFTLSFEEQSRRFRCSVTRKLMTNPCEALDGGLVDESQLTSLDPLRRAQYRPLEALREEIREFSKATILSLQTDLRTDNVMPALIDIVGECLSVLCPKRDKQTFMTLFEQIQAKQLESLLQNLQSRDNFKLISALRHSVVRAEDLDRADAQIKLAYQATKQVILRLFGGVDRRSSTSKEWMVWYMHDVHSLMQSIKEQDKLNYSDYEMISSTFKQEVQTLMNFKRKRQRSVEDLQLMVDAHLAKLHDIEALVTDLVSHKPIEVLPHDSREPLEEHYYTAWYSLFKIKIANGVASMTPIIEYVGSRKCVIDAVQGLAYKVEYGNRYSTLDLRRDLAETVLPKPIQDERPSSLAVHEGVLYSIGRNRTWYEHEPQCERYFISQRRWESLPPLHTDVMVYFSVVLDSTECLYALGPDESWDMVLVQELNLRTLTWRVLGSFKGKAEGTYYFKGSSNSEFYFIDENRGCFVFRPGKDNFTIKKIAETRRTGVQMAFILRGHLVYAGRKSLEVLVDKLRN